MRRKSPPGNFQNYLGSWALLVKRGHLKVSQRFHVHRKVGKTSPFLLRENSYISLVKVPVLATSQKVPKSQEALMSFREEDNMKYSSVLRCRTYFNWPEDISRLVLESSQSPCRQLLQLSI